MQKKELDAEGLEFDLWKAVGDELIFTCVVKSERQICNAVDVWVATLRAYKANNLKDHPGLGVKGGVFLGTFPGPDHESTIPLKPDYETSGLDVVVLNQRALAAQPRERGKYLFDYFGPSIDTGFRVVGRCNARHMTLSVEVALAIALVGDTQLDGDKRQYLELKLMDSIELKGVWGGREYPVFAIDLNHSDPVNAAMERLRGPVFDAKKIRAVCEACYDSEGWPFRVFLPDAALESLRTPPSDPLAQYLQDADTEESGNEVVAEDPPDSEDHLPESAPTS